MLLGRGTSRWLPMAVASIVMGLAGAAIFLLPLPALLIFLLCLIFSAVGGLLPATALTSVPLLAAPRLAPLALGLVMQGSNLGQVVAPVTIGAAVDAGGWTAAAWPVVIAAALALALAFFLRRFPVMTR